MPIAVRELVLRSEDQVFVSRVSLWEMAIKISIGKLAMDLHRFIAQVEATGFDWLDLRNDHILAVAKLPLFEDHRDPFDRLLVAQCLAEPLVLLTVDASLGRYGPSVQVH